MPRPNAAHLRQAWSSSKTFRRVLVVAAIFAVLRLVAQFGTALSESYFPDDLRIYLDAARDFRDQRELYPPLPLEAMEFYQYAPSFALSIIPFTWMSKTVAAILHTLLHAGIYVLLYTSWDRMFARWKIERGRAMLAWTLPVWLVFSVFWDDMAYLNVYLLTALLATLLIEAVMDEHLGPAVLWLSIILQIKPQWAFAAAVPLLLGRTRFFGRLIVAAAGVYAAVIGIVMLTGGIDYGGGQYREYVHLLTRIGSDFPWRGPDDPFLGYNHSIVQTAVYVFGDRPLAFVLALLIRLALLAPLIVIALRCLRHPVRQPGREVPVLALDLALALYTATFIWLDVVWELALGIAVFSYLLAVLTHKTVIRLVWAIFVPYALLDAWRSITYGALGDEVVDPGDYVLTDPSIYFPMIMIVIVLFYGLLVYRLWTETGPTAPPEWAAEVPAAGIQ